jgi:hypothetical protein
MDASPSLGLGQVACDRPETFDLGLDLRRELLGLVAAKARNLPCPTCGNAAERGAK